MSANTTGTSNRRLRALLLDQDPFSVRLVRAALQCRGFEVAVAADGVAGVRALLDELLRLDVLLVSLDLPVRDGWALLRLIRGAGGERDLPVVVAVDGATDAVRAQLRALGADAVVDRSAGPAALADTVERSLEARAWLRGSLAA
jgi:CheY-like chemotaxis protein